MKVAMFAHPDGCGYYRCTVPGDAARKAGVDVSMINLRFKYAVRAGETVVTEIEAIDADVVVLQRPLLRLMVEAIPFLRAMGIAIVVEVDDDFHSIEAEHPGFNAQFNPSVNRDCNWDHLMRACEEADLVTVTTPALAERYGCGHDRLIRNAVPDEFCDSTRPVTDGKTVGWLGTMQVHIDSLQVVGLGISDALEATGGRFHVIGDGDGVREALSLREEPSRTGLIALYAVQPALQRLDVGIAPLASRRGTRAKSALKPIEYAAASIPSVASPTPEYERLASQGGCAIARTPEEWRDRVRELLDDPDRAREIGASYREVIRQHHVISKTVDRWIDAWETAVKAARRDRSKVRTGSTNVA